nr:immunoglobulin light chain junction region [Macaca mulatta]MPN65657.1 immunoglobulin light chain junction region [Macaca mulatta]MPN67225.1 immunoglobulin light chain junction region [Macaca mulatta]MPN67607.1 immunoglobulin light chain junction region [Macaca mulatta]
CQVWDSSSDHDLF